MSHECPREGCTESVSNGKLMCAGDWRKVPRPLQRAIWAAWKDGRGAGSRAHRAAMAAAIRAANGEPAGGTADAG